MNPVVKTLTALLVFSLPALSLDLSGWVVDRTTKAPLVGATVSLQDNSVSATTNAAGWFNLKTTVPVIQGSMRQSDVPFAVHGSRLTLPVSTGILSVQIFDMRGRCVSKTTMALHRSMVVDLRAIVNLRSSGSYQVRLRWESGDYTFRIALGNRLVTVGSMISGAPSASAAGLTKLTAAPISAGGPGTLTIAKTGYLTGTIIYARDIDTLDTITLLANNVGVTQCAADVYQIATYEVKNSQLFVYSPQSIAEKRSCDTTALKTTFDTTFADTGIYPIGTVTDSLVIVDNGRRDTIKVGANTDTVKVLKKTVYHRSGTGTGVQGVWLFYRVEYVPVGGVQNAATLAQMKINADREAEIAIRGKMCSTVDATTITHKIDSSVVRSYMVDYLVPVFDFSVNFFSSICTTSQFKGTVRKATDSTIQITGTVTGEVVTIRIKKNADMVYTSSKAGRTAYTYYANPTVCPNAFFPTWFFPDFKNATSSSILLMLTSNFILANTSNVATCLASLNGAGGTLPKRAIAVIPQMPFLK